MNRLVVAGLLGMALAGCAQSRPVVSRANPHLSAVELTPGMASIHESINRENPKVDPRSLRADLSAMAAAQESADGGLAIVPRTVGALAAAGRTASRPGGRVVEDASPASNSEAPVAAATPADPSAAPTDSGGESAAAMGPAAGQQPAIVLAPEVARPAEAPAPGDPGRDWAEAERAAVAEPVGTVEGDGIAPTVAETTRAGGEAPVPDATRAPSGHPLLDYDPFAEPPPADVHPSAQSAPPIPPTLPRELPADQLPATPAAPPKAMPEPTAPPAEPQPAAAPQEPEPQTAAAPQEPEPHPVAPTQAPEPQPAAAPQEPVPQPVPAPQGPEPAPAPPRKSIPPAERGAMPGLEASPSWTGDWPPATKPPAPAINEPPAPPSKMMPDVPPAPAEPTSDTAPATPAPDAAEPVEQAEPSAPEAPAAPSPPTQPGETPAPAGDAADPAVAPTTVSDRKKDRLLGPRPDLWPEIILPPPPALPEAAKPSTAAALENHGASEMPAPAALPEDAAEVRSVVEEPDAPGTDPNAPPEPAPPVEEAPAAGDAGAPPEPLPAPELPPAEGDSASSGTFDPAIRRTSDETTATPSPPDEPEPLPFDPAELPIELPSISGPEASLMNTDGLRPGIPDSPPLELPITTASRRVEPAVGTAAAARATGTTDIQVRRASLQNEATPETDPTAARIANELDPDASRVVFEAGRPAARVGDEVITLLELKKAIALRRKTLPEGPMDANTRYALARAVLGDLVDRTIVLQEARRTFKSPKQMDIFRTMADKVWDEEELPPLLRDHLVSNVHELRRKLEEKGDSLDERREAFRREYLFRGFIEHKVGPRLKVELPEMRRYYMDHIKEFDRPAQVTWREVLIESDKAGGRDAARSKAEDVVRRLLRGADFAAIAREESDGPNRSSGGLWQTSPGGYAVKEVSDAIDVLPIGRVSRAIEGPTGYHVVRVESRRAAGPAPFGEVQDQIFKTLRGQKIQRESTAYLDRLRKQTVVTTVFDAPARAPGAVAPRTSAN